MKIIRKVGRERDSEAEKATFSWILTVGPLVDCLDAQHFSFLLLWELMF